MLLLLLLRLLFWTHESDFTSLTYTRLNDFLSQCREVHINKENTEQQSTTSIYSILFS